MINIKQTKTALLLLVGGSASVAIGGAAGLLLDPSNFGFWFALVGGIGLLLFAMIGLLHKPLFRRLCIR